MGKTTGQRLAEDWNEHKKHYNRLSATFDDMEALSYHAMVMNGISSQVSKTKREDVKRDFELWLQDY